jgi:hypothetical protein
MEIKLSDERSCHLPFKEHSKFISLVIRCGTPKRARRENRWRIVVGRMRDCSDQSCECLRFPMHHKTRYPSTWVNPSPEPVGRIVCRHSPRRQAARVWRAALTDATVLVLWNGEKLALAPTLDHSMINVLRRSQDRSLAFQVVLMTMHSQFALFGRSNSPQAVCLVRLFAVAVVSMAESRQWQLAHFAEGHSRARHLFYRRDSPVLQNVAVRSAVMFWPKVRPRLDDDYSELDARLELQTSPIAFTHRMIVSPCITAMIVRWLFQDELIPIWSQFSLFGQSNSPQTVY